MSLNVTIDGMDSVLEWLMEGDPAIRWQAMRDLLDEPESAWERERARCLTEGWGLQFLSFLSPDLDWPVGRWTGTTWTQLLLMDCGLPSSDQRLGRAAQAFLDNNLPKEQPSEYKSVLPRYELCHLGFWLRIGAYWRSSDERLPEVSQAILGMQMADGGWNCHIRTKPKTKHSSFHTTFNVLEGLSLAARAGIVAPSQFREAERKALEFMLAHQMYRSDHTGEVIHERFTHLTFPSHWHYTVLRGLDYMRNCPEIGDPRLADPIALLESRRKPNGRWPVEKRIPGVTLFEMERMGGDSRWNTLRALRVLRQHRAAN